MLVRFASLMMSRRNCSSSIFARRMRSASHSIWLAGRLLSWLRLRGSLVVSLPSGPTPTGIDLGTDRRACRCGSRSPGSRLKRSQPCVTVSTALRSSRTAAEIPHDVLQGLQGLALPLAGDHLRGQVAIGDRGIAHFVRVFALVVHVREAIAPVPVRAQALLGDLGAARQHDLLRAHVGRHDADQIVRAEDPVDQADQRLGDRVRGLERHVRLIQEDHEHAVARVLGRLQHLALRRGLDPLALRPGRPTTTCSKLSTFCGTPSSAISKSAACRSRTGWPSLRRIDVHPDEVRLARNVGGRCSPAGCGGGGCAGARRRGGRAGAALRRADWAPGPDGQAHKDDDDGGAIEWIGARDVLTGEAWRSESMTKRFAPGKVLRVRRVRGGFDQVLRVPRVHGFDGSGLRGSWSRAAKQAAEADRWSYEVSAFRAHGAGGRSTGARGGTVLPSLVAEPPFVAARPAERELLLLETAPSAPGPNPGTPGLRSASSRREGRTRRRFGGGADTTAHARWAAGWLRSRLASPSPTELSWSAQSLRAEARPVKRRHKSSAVTKAAGVRYDDRSTG